MSKPAAKPAAAAAAPAKPAAAAAASAPAAKIFSEGGPPPVVALAVKTDVVPAGRQRRQSVIAGGVTRTSNTVDLTKKEGGKDGGQEKDPSKPNFFVLVSETSLYAGTPNQAGAIDGPATVAKFNTPSDIVVDRNQQLFVADTENARIRRISKQGQVSTVAAIGGGDGDIENFPHGLAFDNNGAMYILQSGLKHQIFQVAPGAGVKLLAGTDEKGHKDSSSDLLKASFNHPRATGVDSQNRIYICEKHNNCIRRLDIEKGTVITLLGPGDIPLDLLNPEGVVVDQFDDVFVADTGHHRILKIVFTQDSNGRETVEVTNYCGKYGQAGYANGPAVGSLLSSPTGLAVDKQNHLWICDSGNNCIRMMAHGAELVFTVSGKGSIEQEKQYHYPTSIALSYDALYGADMADSCPDAVRADPTHPLYFSYITPVIFVADSGSHCIRKIHTVMMEAAKALIDVCTPAAASSDNDDDCPMHNALSYGVTNQRNPLMAVLLQLKPQLLQQRDKKGRIPLHIACLESATITAGTISMDIINKMLGMAQPNSVASILTEDDEGRIPLSYALQKMQEHTANVEQEKMERGEDEEPNVDNPDHPWDMSRMLLNAMLSLCPQALSHKSCRQFTLHTLIAAGVPLKFLKKFAQAIEDAREGVESEGMAESSYTTLFELKAAALAKHPNPFFERDEQGRLPLHVACQMHCDPFYPKPVPLEVCQWLVFLGQLPPLNPQLPQTWKTRDLTLKGQKGGKDGVDGHHAMFYACTVPRAPAPGAPANAPVLHKPIHKIPPVQVQIIEFLLDCWPDSILQNEAAGVLHASPFQNTSMKPHTFLEWVFYHRALELLEIFLRRLPKCLDSIVWIDSLDVLTPADSAASEIGKDGRKKRRNSAGPNTLTMLHSAAKINDKDLLELILKHNANPFLTDKRDKLPVDYTTDADCKKLLTSYMDKDARKPIVPVEKVEIGVQTGVDEDAAKEKARMEAEAKRLAEKEAELKALLESEREAARKKALEDAKAIDAAKAQLAAEAEAEKKRLAAEAEAEKLRLANEAAAEKARLAALDAERASAAEQARIKLEAELKAAAEEERVRLQSEADAEKARLAQLDAEREEARKKFETEMKAADEARAAAAKAQEEALNAADAAREAARIKLEKELKEAAESEKARLAAEAEAERARLQSEADAEKARMAELDAQREEARKKLEAELKAASEEERVRLQAEADAEKARLAALDAEREEARKKLEAEMKAAEEAREAARKKLEEEMRAADAAREAARIKLEAEMKAANDEERARLQAEADAAAARMAQLDAERAEAQRKMEEDLKRAQEEEAERERLRQLKEAKMAEQRDQSRREAEEAARIRAEAEAAMKRMADEKALSDAARLAAEEAAKAAEAARLAAEADAEEARRRREHQWNLNAEHEARLKAEQEAALANAAANPPVSARKEDLGDLKRVPQKKKQSPAELAALARAQAAIEAAAAKRNAPKKVLGFGSSTLKQESH